VEGFDLALRTLGLIFSAAAVALAYVKQRQIWMDRAKALLPSIEQAAISELNGKMRLLEHTVESQHLTLDQCERARDAAYEALAAWDHLIGNIWINHGATETNDGD
jgi:hypothetical protein